MAATPNQANMRRELRASTLAVGGTPSVVDVGMWLGDRVEFAEQELLAGALRDVSRGAGGGLQEYGRGGGDAQRRIGTGAAVAIAALAVMVPVVVGGVVIVATRA